MLLRINTCVLNLVVPNCATTLNAAFLNIDAVPCVDSFPKARDSQRVLFGNPQGR
jgi:hypothetical protein